MRAALNPLYLPIMTIMRQKRVPNLIERIQGGEAIALISDAGTPLVSDPGFKLGRACIEAGA